MLDKKIILSGVSSVVSKCGNAGDSDSVMFLRRVSVFVVGLRFPPSKASVFESRPSSMSQHFPSRAR